MTTPSATPEGPAAPPRRPRLLIVDDELAHLQALCDTLGTVGYETTGCANAEQALQALAAASFDLLLSDLQMPGMDGIALMRAALARDPSLTCVIMTGQGSVATAVAAMQAGALDYILKPFKLSAALPVLSRAVQVRELRVRNARLEAQVLRQLHELEASNRDLESFSYSVSHDLRSPLQAIGGFSRMLADRAGPRMDDTSRHYLDRIRAGVQRMDQLVDGLLDLARVARKPLNLRQVDMGGLVQAVAADMVAAGHLDGSMLHVACDLPPASGDPVLLRQVLVNLLSNAAKFSGQREVPRIEVGYSMREGMPEYFIKDNGAGFEMAYAARLFEPFQRFHHEGEFSGTGIGLSIVHRIVARHGGTIRAEAEPDQGACFFFTLAPAPTHAPAAATLKNAPPAPTSAS
jgi:signal transduction histidine kinase